MLLPCWENLSAMRLRFLDGLAERVIGKLEHRVFHFAFEFARLDAGDEFLEQAILLGVESDLAAFGLGGAFDFLADLGFFLELGLQSIQSGLHAVAGWIKLGLRKLQRFLRVGDERFQVFGNAGLLPNIGGRRDGFLRGLQFGHRPLRGAQKRVAAKRHSLLRQEQVGVTVEDLAADALGLEEAPLVTCLRLILAGDAAIILGERHFAGGSADQKRGDHRQDHRRGDDSRLEPRFLRFRRRLGRRGGGFHGILGGVIGTGQEGLPAL